MNYNLIILIANILAGYGALELFGMAVRAEKERRICVILQCACGFSLCVWVIVDRSIVNIPLIAALAFIALDRLQTRILRT
jgi:hypothetical protein